MRLGRNALAAGRFEEAIAHYQTARKSLPNHPGVLLNLCIAQYSAQQIEAALSSCRQVKGNDPALAPARLFEGLALLKLGQTEAAIAPLGKYLSQRPAQPDALFELANARLTLGHGMQALSLFEQLRDLNPRNPKAWQGIGLSHLRISEQLFEKQAPGSAEWHALTGLALVDQGQYKQAFAHLRQAATQNSALPGVHAGLAEVYRLTGHADWAAAEEAKEPKGQAADSTYTQALFHSQAALEAFEQLSRLPESPALLEVQANAERARGHYRESAGLFEKALAKAPGDPRLQAEYTRTLFLANDFDAALPLARRWNLPDVAGAILLEQGDAEGAITMLAKSQRPEAKARLGEAYLKANQPAKAIPLLAAAAATDRDGRWHLLLSRAYQRTGQTEKAAAAQRQYQQISQAAEQTAPAGEITPP